MNSNSKQQAYNQITTQFNFSSRILFCTIYIGHVSPPRPLSPQAHIDIVTYIYIVIAHCKHILHAFTIFIKQKKLSLCPFDVNDPLAYHCYYWRRPLTTMTTIVPLDRSTSARQEKTGQNDYPLRPSGSFSNRLFTAWA